MPCFAVSLRAPDVAPDIDDIIGKLRVAGVEPTAQSEPYNGKGTSILITSPLSRFDVDIVIDGQFLHAECVVPVFCGTMYPYWCLVRCLRDLGYVSRDNGELPRVPKWAEASWPELSKWKRLLQR
jgi:hypothetical protein